jgi:hypothetical protein
MEPVIAWALGVGSVIFGLGLISALASRKQRRSKTKIGRAFTEVAQPSQNDKVRPSAADMASRGVGNGEEYLASIGNSSR